MGCSGLSRAGVLDQMRRQRTQRPQLPADQRQLRLHQSLPFIYLIRHLLQVRGQGFLGIALDRNGLLVGQPRGDLIDARREGLARAVDQVFVHLGRQLRVAVRAEP